VSRAVLAALLAAAAAARLPAQGVPGGGSGAIHGVVRDGATDSAVAGAHVLLTGTPLATTTDEAGAFTIVGLAPGSYTLRVLSIGYAPGVVTGVLVRGGATAAVAVHLERVALQLPGITVTATGAAQKVGESAVSVSIVERDELIHYNPVQVQDALPFVPGVEVSHGSVDIRGATGLAGGIGSRVLMLLDGHPVLTGDGGEIDFEVLPMLDLERAEVVKGAQSALYGSAAMGGVVNLITSPIDERSQTDVKLHYGAYDVPKTYRFTDGRLAYRGLDLQHSRALGPVGIRLALGRETSDGYQQNGDLSRWLLRAKLSSMPGSAHPWDAYAIWTSLVSGQFSAWRSPDQPYLVDTVNAAVGDHDRVINLLLGGKFVALAGSRAMLQLEPSLTHTLVRDHMKQSQNWHTATRTGVNAQLLFNPGSEHAVTAGVDVANTAVNSSYYGWKRIVDAAPYAQEELRLTPTLHLTAGVRLDSHHADGGRAEAALNPKLGVAYAPAGPFAFRASLGRGYRAPSAIEQFVDTRQQGVHVVANPSLHGESAWSGEVGGTASLGRLWVDAALYASWYRGLIGPAAVAGQPLTFSFQNVSRARVRGLDAASKLAVVPRAVDLRLSYVYLDSRDDSTGLALPYRSRHTLTGSLDLLGGAAGIDVRYRSRIEQVLEFPLDPRTAITLVDLRFAFRVGTTTMLATVSNLLQAKYVDVMERNEGAPRSLRLTGMATF
jgi:outer membrane receptor for ferrienterochelin and colicins